MTRFIFFFLFFSNIAFADYEPIWFYQRTSAQSAIQSTASSPQSAIHQLMSQSCSSGTSYDSANLISWTDSPSGTGTGTFNGTCITPSGVKSSLGVTAFIRSGRCNSGDSYVTGSNGKNICQDGCPAGQQKINGVCTNNNCDDDSFFGVRAVGYAGCSMPQLVCISQCAYNYYELVGTSVCAGNSLYEKALYKSNGSPCTASDFEGGDGGTGSLGAGENDPVTPEEDCIKRGMSFGTINGQVICVPKSTEGSQKLTEKTSSTQTSTTTNNVTNTSSTTNTSTSYTVVNNPDGTQSVKKTETNDKDGASTTVETEQTKDDFCELNPNNKICKDSGNSKFEGSCSQGFICEGDALQCAIAQQQHKIYCDSAQNNDEINALLAGDDDASSGGAIRANTSIILPESLNTQNYLSKSCPPDIVFPIVGHSIVLPLSKLCPSLQFAGQIVLMASYLIALGIIFRRS